MRSSEKKMVWVRASTSSGDDETVVMGLAFTKCSTSQRMVLNMSSVRIWLPMMALNESLTDLMSRSHTPPK